MFCGIADEGRALSAAAGRVTGRWKGAAHAAHVVASSAAITLPAGLHLNGGLFRVVIMPRTPRMAAGTARRFLARALECVASHSAPRRRGWLNHANLQLHSQ
jgi:hypothetical protein